MDKLRSIINKTISPPKKDITSIGNYPLIKFTVVLIVLLITAIVFFYIQYTAVEVVTENGIYTPSLGTNSRITSTDWMNIYHEYDDELYSDNTTLAFNIYGLFDTSWTNETINMILFTDDIDVLGTSRKVIRDAKYYYVMEYNSGYNDYTCTRYTKTITDTEPKIKLEVEHRAYHDTMCKYYNTTAINHENIRSITVDVSSVMAPKAMQIVYMDGTSTIEYTDYTYWNNSFKYDLGMYSLYIGE